MSENNQTNSEGSTSNLGVEAAPVVPTTTQALKSRADRNKRRLVMVPILVLAVMLRLGFIDLPKVWAQFGGSSGGHKGDYPCSDCPCPEGDNGGDDDGDDGCGSCGPGMPKWWVSEPWMNLWLKDTPLFYQPSRGRAIEFRLLFENRQDNTLHDEMVLTNIFSLGQNWASPWRCYLRTNAGSIGTFDFFNGLGAVVTITNGSGQAYRERSECGWPGASPQVKYPSGAIDEFGLKVTIQGVARHFLTSRSDPFGNSIQFAYTTTGNITRLTTVTDVDSKVTTLTYTNINDYTLLYQVSDPNGHTATLRYDTNTPVGAPPYLTTILDAANLSSSFAYDNSKGLTNLTTPYGITTFTVGPATGTVNPAWVHVNQLGVRDHLYLYRATDPGDKIPDSYAAWAPSTTPFTITFDTDESDWRNSFHWGPRQYALLPAGVLAGLADATPYLDPDALDGTNYLHARQRHWLKDSLGNLGQTLSLQRAPSPDGVTQGQITWYDYSGKSDPKSEGDMILPRFKAWLLPNGESRFVRSLRNILGHATNVVETYSDGGGKFRTNVLIYASDNINLLTVTNVAGIRAVSNVFNASHRIVTNYNASNEMTVFIYDGNNQLTNSKTPAGLTTTNLYGADGYLSKTIDLEINRTNTYTWSNGTMYSHTDERGLIVTNTWDGLNRLVKVRYGDAGGTYVTNVYDKLDLIRTIDRMGFTNRYEYNGFRKMVRSIDELNRTNSYDYCDCGVLSSITDPLNQLTRFYYDLSGRRVATVYADNYAVTNNYDLMGRLTNVVDSAGSSVTNWFNNQGLLVASSNAFGRVQSIVYDSEDRSTNTVDANGVSITNSFDVLGRLRTRTYPDGGVERFGYSARGMVAYTNQLSQTNFYVYDEARRKTMETNANWQVTQFRYDSSGNLTNLLDGKSQNTTWRYDEYSRVTNKLDAAGTEIFRYAYDLNDRLTDRWSATKGTTVYRYDRVGNLTNVDYPVSLDITLKYDPLNRLTNMVDAVGATVYGYDAAGLLLSENGPWANDTVTNGYNNRLRTSLSVLAPNASAWTESYAYDGDKRMTNVTSPAGAFGYLYDATRKLRVGKLTLPNTSYITNNYDSVGRLLNTTLKNSAATVLNSHAYVYDLGNERTKQTRTDGSYVDYGYDNIGQLKTANGKESGGTTNRWQEQFGYAYDAAWNLNYRTNNALVQTFNVNSLNELTTVARSGTLTVAGTTTRQATNVTVNTSNAFLYTDITFASTNHSLIDGNNTFTAIAKDSSGRQDTNAVTLNLPATANYLYDTNGNLTSDGRRGFDYDDENQLIRVTVTNAWKSEFTYDGQLRRRIRKEFDWQSSAWVKTNEVRYVYDGNLVIQERDGYNLPAVTYTLGKDLSGSLQRAGGIGGLLARTDNTLLLTPGSIPHAYYHADGNGNVTCLINTNQIVVARYLYDPYGNTLSASGPLAEANLYRFSSKEWHPNSGLVYYLYRYYDASLQRWLSRDPMEEEGGLNLYGYVYNGPPNAYDPFGLAGGPSGSRPPPPPPSRPPSRPIPRPPPPKTPTRDPRHGWGVPDDTTETPPTFGPSGDASNLAVYEPGHIHPWHEPHHNEPPSESPEPKPDPNLHTIKQYDPTSGETLVFRWRTEPSVPPPVLYNCTISPGNLVSQNAPPSSVSFPK